MDLRWLTVGDGQALIEASGVFDFSVQKQWAVRFLQQPNHHLCIAYEDGRVAGFVSGVETTHPDKGTEMFLYELGVNESFRGRGIGKALITALRDRAEDRGCYGMWVLQVSLGGLLLLDGANKNSCWHTHTPDSGRLASCP